MSDSGYPAATYSTDTHVLQSFTNRIIDATNTWNQQTTSHAHAKTIQYSSSIANILFRNVSPPQPSSGALLGYTYVQTSAYTTPTSNFYGACPHDYPGNNALKYVRIDTQQRDDWFTQDNTQRSAWENCSGTSYTCQRKVDFGSVATHELGHALGEAHPESYGEQLDADCGTSTTASQTHDDSTMCPITPNYATRQRTLTVWDTYSYATHMNSF